ncbi:MAG: hypothetical protein KZQ64_08805 [gamma proteobacterium symbiont of Bathyaustriella thionipta]|nr:hypothetical protein [gamma proteobacterium symbiont of Bathyaustriella thionipta]MCU7949910.1 hypothetical protein [gamma proteobacterium symbiont of Bathyaustriella thionipta]MCU7953472.1 hypothetical protein [gamma proteobacterium symbiont of Bathyaustriella thionipta]MCU7955579.1 hypothetical protein [gamma proteobacterium symbiont of Bathyaustriella thionipta]MCU7965879.1 hypothetical protein [gamma proteobacterium symbiont of Bathyaustriella thionipta]
MTRSVSVKLFLSVLFLIITAAAAQAENLKPFYLADAASGDFTQTVTDTKSKLSAAGFEVVGEYSPYKGASIIIVTNDALKNNAKATEFGGYGAVQRIAVTDMAGTIQVTYTNPNYMAAAYRMAGSLDDVAAALKGALGMQKTYGSEKGLSKDDLEGYHYMFGMPYFDDPDVVAEHGSYDKAMQQVKAGLAAKKGGVSKVYQVDIPGKKQTVIGVAMTEGMSDDKTIMTEVDFKETRSTAHLPYEMLIHENGKVYALSAKFRIATSFPDLSMAGSNSFMGIMASPDAIKKALSQAAGAKVEKAESTGGFGF